ncbi:MAG: hypothetical protein RLZZ262_2440, partial [Bacteroidota bacterium]
MARFRIVNKVNFLFSIWLVEGDESNYLAQDLEIKSQCLFRG